MNLKALFIGAVLSSALLTGCTQLKPVDEHCDDPIFEQYDLDICKAVDPTITGDPYTS